MATNGRPNNIGEAVFGAIGNTLSGLAQAYPQMAQQKRENDLQERLMAMREAQAKREQELFQQQVALGRANLVNINSKNKDLLRKLAMTPEERANDVALEERAKLDAAIAFLSSPNAQAYLQGLQPGTRADFGAVSLSLPDAPGATVGGIPFDKIANPSLTDVALWNEAGGDYGEFLRRKALFNQSAYNRSSGLQADDYFRIGKQIADSRLKQIDTEIRSIEATQETQMREDPALTQKKNNLLQERAKIEQMVADSSVVWGQRALGADAVTNESVTNDGVSTEEDLDAWLNEILK